MPFNIYTGFPLTLHLKFSCIFPVQQKISPVPVSMIVPQAFNINYRHSTEKNVRIILGKFLLNCLYLGQNSKFPVFLLTGIFLNPHFPCALGTLLR